MMSDGVSESEYESDEGFVISDDVDDVDNELCSSDDMLIKRRRNDGRRRMHIIDDNDEEDANGDGDVIGQKERKRKRKREKIDARFTAAAAASMSLQTYLQRHNHTTHVDDVSDDNNDDGNTKEYDADEERKKGRLLCHYCMTWKSRDDFSANQQRVATQQDGVGYCLLHHGGPKHCNYTSILEGFRKQRMERDILSMEDKKRRHQSHHDNAPEDECIRTEKTVTGHLLKESVHHEKKFKTCRDQKQAKEKKEKKKKKKTKEKSKVNSRPNATDEDAIEAMAAAAELAMISNDELTSSSSECTDNSDDDIDDESSKDSSNIECASSSAHVPEPATQKAYHLRQKKLTDFFHLSRNDITSNRSSVYNAKSGVSNVKAQGGNVRRRAVISSSDDSYD